MNITRKDPWMNITAAKNRDAYDFIKEYLRDKRGDYESADVRILERRTCSSFEQYFQISVLRKKGQPRQFFSTRIYNDAEEKRIRDNVPGIPTYCTYPMWKKEGIYFSGWIYVAVLNKTFYLKW